MFDISWTEFLLIGVVALIVIGPKELPAVMRTMGQWTRKMRSMAADFQGQFQEAMREAEMTDLKKQVDDMAQEVKNYDPLKSVREDVAAMGRDVEASLGPPAAATPAASADGTSAPVTLAASELPASEPDAAAPGPAVPPVQEFPLPEAAAQLADKDVVGAATGPVAPDTAADHAAAPRSTEPTV